MNFNAVIINSLTLFSKNIENKLNLDNQLHSRYVLNDKLIDGFELFKNNEIKNNNNIQVETKWEQMSDDEKNKYVKNELFDVCNNDNCNKKIFQDNLCKTHYKQKINENNKQIYKKSNDFYNNNNDNNILVEYEYNNIKYLRDVFNNLYSISNTTLTLIGYIEDSTVLFINI